MNNLDLGKIVKQVNKAQKNKKRKIIIHVHVQRKNMDVFFTELGVKIYPCQTLLIGDDLHVWL